MYGILQRKRWPDRGKPVGPRGEEIGKKEEDTRLPARIGVFLPLDAILKRKDEINMNNLLRDCYEIIEMAKPAGEAGFAERKEEIERRGIGKIFLWPWECWHHLADGLGTSNMLISYTVKMNSK